jgi:hypothetical protein
MRLIVFFQLALFQTAIAGHCNVANLTQEEEHTIEVECDKRTQPFTLPAGSDSGTFALPNKEAVFRAKDQEIAPCKIPAGRDGHLILLYRKNKELAWHTVSSKAEKDKTSLRLLNLTDQAVKLRTAERDIELAAHQDLASVPTKTQNITVTLEGQEKQTATAEEPTAFLGVIYPTPQGPRMRLIADR